MESSFDYGQDSETVTKVDTGKTSDGREPRRGAPDRAVRAGDDAYRRYYHTYAQCRTPLLRLWRADPAGLRLPLTAFAASSGSCRSAD